MGSLGDELSLGSRRPTSIPTTIYGFPTKAYKIMNVEKLEEEKMKIQGSDLDLPLCLQILNDAISYLKEESKRCSEMDTQPLLRDFISGDGLLLKREEKKLELWREDDHIPNGRFSDTNNKLDVERNEEKPYGLLNPGMKTPEVETGLGLGLASCSMVNGGRSKGIGFTSNVSVPQPPPYLQQQALLRKQRRCWTPELHRRFVDALQQLGGPGVATPKQIREHMQEEGLTNDEVKSHLQKYRLHIRKSNSNPEKQSVVVLGFNLWNSSSQDEEEGGESSKRSNSQSDSPQGPLHLPCTTTTTTGGDSSMEDTEDAKSESFQIGRD
ncbi:Homeodomain-like superfamily protein [Raphanus sativus]|uniref:Transcription factor HHO6 n=1 Tax=Raphanus sativus TaxID=3726 RepID=A0A6J0L138_RAPSA|nr:transcription factor HHO6 [Raphanus sativus]XP_056843881.1 transcription factor HHO6 [Raphanus sativus]XP_056843886.1 transcription factor HHO6 [Raphanus sativus]XP_056843888.1 transcription factor HHO6 [Raphanus sativus]KAJ4917569.1 Homeodomain-like superfamily protein [Raphanus sativus]